MPVNARFSAEEAAYLIRNSEASTLIYADDVGAVVKGIRESVPEITRYISTGKSEAGALSYEGLLESASDEEPPTKVSPDDMTMIMYTSGATGAPKGVVATQRNIMANTNTMCLELDIVPEDVTALAMPIYHNGGLWPTMSIVYRGGTNILMPRFDLDALLQIIQDRKVTFLNLVPTMLLRLVSHPNLSSYDLDSLRTIMYAGAPIPLEQLKNAMRILGPHRFYNSLGSHRIERQSHLDAHHPARPGGTHGGKLGSVGIDAMGVEIAIVDELGNELPRGVVGEIIGKGDNISPGYWKLPEGVGRNIQKRLALYRGHGLQGRRRLHLHRRQKKRHHHQRRREHREP